MSLSSWLELLSAGIPRLNLGGLFLGVLIGWVVFALFRGFANIYFHPLSSFPGPRIAAFTGLYKAYIDIVAKSSFVKTLELAHAKYGDVVRIGPNEIHFSRPEVYHEIYNANNRWLKEPALYHSFGEDRSSFGFLDYKDAKPRKDILQPVFSRKAVIEVENLVQEKVDQLCESFKRRGTQPVNLFYAFRCMSVDVITYICFGKSIDAIDAPAHEAPIVTAMDASLPAFNAFKHSYLYKNMIINCPPGISRAISPLTAGLVDLQEILREQIRSITKNPDELEKMPHPTIYHQLLKAENHPNGVVPDAEELFEESQALMFGGADTTGTTMMHGCFYILTQPDVLRKLQTELQQAWPKIEEPPKWAGLEKLPYLTATIKESLRLSPGVASPLPRVAPSSGVDLDGKFIPGGTIVEMSSHFVHRNPRIFEEPDMFIPERWLGPEGRYLDRWIVSFSKGPRSCLGLNLAWAEMYLTFAHIFRKFDYDIDPSSPKELVWRDCFLPEYSGPHLKAKVTVRHM